MDACRAAFGQLKPDEIDVEVIKRVYSLVGGGALLVRPH